jgi:hypothetical protein
MWRAAIAFLLALAAPAANAQDTRSGQSQAPSVTGGDDLRPFLFDARMPGDGSRHRAVPTGKHPGAGAIVMPPKASPPERER